MATQIPTREQRLKQIIFRLRIALVSASTKLCSSEDCSRLPQQLKAASEYGLDGEVKPMPTLREFIDRLYDDGWRAQGDAQHEHIAIYYKELFGDLDT